MICHVNAQRLDVFAPEHFGELQSKLFSDIDEQHGRALSGIFDGSTPQHM